MKIYLTSVFVDDQQKALDFYTGKLGFVKKHDMPVGDFRWLTLTSPEGPDDVELLLEPNANEVARTYQQAHYAQGIPAASFLVENIREEVERLTALGVAFAVEPTIAVDVTMAVFDDTCGNLIQIVQLNE